MCMCVCAPVLPSLPVSSQQTDFHKGIDVISTESNPNSVLLATCFLLGLLFDPQDIPPKRQWSYGVTSHKMVLFIVTAVRTRNSTDNNFVIIIQFNSILVYLRVNLTAQKPITKLAR
jgi:hypothetical protein